MTDVERDGAEQPSRFNPARAARLDDSARFTYLPPSELLSLLDLEPGARLIDFGAGTGTYAIEFARARPDIHIFALDEQPEMLEMLRAKVAATEISTVEPLGTTGGVDEPRLASLSGTADRILALNVLHELGDRALAGLPWLLRPNGRALVVDWNGDVERPVGPPRGHVYGPARASQRLLAHGLSVRDTRLFPYHYALTCVLAGTRSKT